MLPQAEAKGSEYISCTSLCLCLRQDCGFQRFVSYLHAVYDPSILKRKLPRIKHVNGSQNMRKHPRNFERARHPVIRRADACIDEN